MLLVPVAQSRVGSGGSLQLLVSACRLWKDLQAFCCSEGKCNFHDNSNLNCTLKVREGWNPRALLQLLRAAALCLVFGVCCGPSS